MVGAYTKQGCNENHTHIGYGFFMYYLKKTRLYLVPLKGSDLCGISEPLKMREFVLIWNFLVICFPVGVSSSRTVFPPV